MISLNSSLQSCVAACCSSIFIVGDFDQPEYYIGQLVWHRVKRLTGETLFPVHIVGLSWTGMDWQYVAELPHYHPWFNFYDCEREWIDDSQLEAM